nr:MAG TPA: hypothetical protein [Caudoviricetes sp.]
MRQLPDRGAPAGRRAGAGGGGVRRHRRGVPAACGAVSGICAGHGRGQS